MRLKKQLMTKHTCSCLERRKQQRLGAVLSEGLAHMHFVDNSNSKFKKKKEHGRRCDAGGSRGTAGAEDAVAAGNKCSRMVTGTPVSHTVP